MGNRDGGACATVPAIMVLLTACMIVTAFPSPAPAGEHDIGMQNDRPATASPARDRSSDRSRVDADDADPWSEHIAEAGCRSAIPEQWIRAVMTVESAGDVRALSSAGAMGLMQIMPATWEELRMKHGLGNDPYDVHDNILAGAAYLREMHDRYGSIAAMLAAYNAGPCRYERHLAGDPLPAETVDYVARIMPMIDSGSVIPLSIRRQSAGSETAGGPLFAVTANSVSASYSPLFVAPSVIESSERKTADCHPSNRPSNSSTITDLSALAPPSDGLFIPRSRH